MSRSNTKVRWQLTLGVLAGSLGLACVAVVEDTVGLGDLTLTYDFDGLGCAAAGVASVDFALTGDRGGLDGVSVDCEPAYYTFLDLPADGYRVNIEAYDPAEGLLYSASFRTTVPRNSAGNINVSLRPAVGALTLYWTFAGSTDCLSVDEVYVELRDPFDVLFDSTYYRCDQAGVSYGDVITGEWRVSLDALSSSNILLYRATDVPFYVDAGEDNAYDIDLGFCGFVGLPGRRRLAAGSRRHSPAAAPCRRAEANHLPAMVTVPMTAPVVMATSLIAAPVVTQIGRLVVVVTPTAAIPVIPAVPVPVGGAALEVDRPGAGDEPERWTDHDLDLAAGRQGHQTGQDRRAAQNALHNRYSSASHRRPHLSCIAKG